MASTLEYPETDDQLAGVFVTFSGMLMAVGMLMVYSSSFTSIPSEEEQTFLFRQMTFLLFSGVLGIAVSRIPPKVWPVIAPVIYVGTIVLLALVLAPGIGRSVNGAQRWFRLGSISFQPSESAKLTVPLMLCVLLYRRNLTHRFTLEHLGICLGLILIPMVLILIEPDLGTALFVGFTASVALWLSGCPKRYFLLAIGSVLPFAMMLFALKPYQLARIRGFVNTWVQPDEAPYQIQQSLITLGTGGVAGVGLGQGWQKLSFLPEANTDFVVAVVGEELGLIGTLGILFLWIAIFLSGIRLVRRTAEDTLERALSMTLLTSLVTQALVNMAVVTALVPPKGISHPFVSYGGSNLGLSVVLLGVIVSLTRSTEKDQEDSPFTAEE
ncbi:FtsW/RodA/SpoVE family cell cycle protein [Planctomicrobium sp. SH668]|uniref:FtsW/RodA/SpoVE family cell cycle protein n=1 Tax=Planctomicrobium sp. SH668 TaxID=3448126 RepID=UPI003F5B25CF